MAVLLGGCGEEASEKSAASASPPIERLIAQAAKVSAADFPATGGRTLQEIADTVLAGPQVGLATSVFTPGENRLAFGLIDKGNALVYGPTALYVARTPQARARGPFPAPAGSLLVEPPFRSRTAAEEDDAVAAIYAAQVPLDRPGRYAVLAVSRAERGLIGAAAQIQVRRSSPIPAVGERAPRVDTDTLASAGGNIEAIETRVPPDDMHQVNFADEVGKRPIALLMATPALCQTRVCGPVTDIAAQLQREFGDRVAFIHQEVYVDNEVASGLRPPLQAFRLRTEPWLFTVDRRGRVAARLEGSFSIEEFRAAVKAAL